MTVAIPLIPPAIKCFALSFIQLKNCFSVYLHAENLIHLEKIIMKFKGIYNESFAANPVLILKLTVTVIM